MDRERGYKRTKRVTKRLEATFSSGGLSFRGILSNISDSGLFIRTNRGFAPNTTLDIELVLPNDVISHLKGIVRRTIRTPLAVKNGMGVELLQKDQAFEAFVRDIYDKRRVDHEESGDIEGETPFAPEFRIIPCPECGVKNKILHSKISQNPKCGKCKAPLVVTP